MELALFGISALLTTVSSVIVATLYVGPWLRTVRPDRALASLVAPHLFLRFIGLSLLMPGVVAAALPRHSPFPPPMEISSQGFWPSARPSDWHDKPPGPAPRSGRSTSGGRLISFMRGLKAYESFPPLAHLEPRSSFRPPSCRRCS